jgi:hypothetical protein
MAAVPASFTYKRVSWLRTVFSLRFTNAQAAGELVRKRGRIGRDAMGARQGT